MEEHQEYSIGTNIIEIHQCEIKKGKPEDSFNCWIFGEYVKINAKNQKEIEQKIADYINSKRIEIQNQANTLEELTLRIKENGLEATSKYYQTLQNKNSEGGNK